ncbi:hypothetical protein SAMN05444411_102318 [Lutibacter oricola]|uniref:Pectate lyase superfamily protein n=1 Tax=Lutibacter oricola TaxID=762486 RepID=A0A1H2WYM0_9FLAO|nr:hypothetical protein [Lutibacter oricola]SDW85606.1 hypothetical protein SAMN05444411_102318 [Lutibacter oricola]
MIRKLFGMLVLCLAFSTVNAQYKEVMNPKGFTVNLKKDYGLKDDNAKNNQSYKLRKAIGEVNAKGGGNIVIPKGVYSLSSIYLKSNVHILIEAGTVIKPMLGEGVVFNLSTDKKDEKKNPKLFVENVSVRGKGGAFIIDYHTRKYKDRQRAIIGKMVKNFLIQDMIVKDNYSVFCGITLAPSNEKVKDVSNWEVSRPTFGTIKNITHYKASPGYGLVQCHGAQNVHFENLYAEGGVSFRLEVGANNKNVGVYDLTAKNIINKNGRCAVMLGPHSAKNGIIKVDGVKSISSTFAVTVGDGGVKKDAPDQTPGYFHKDSSIDNIVAIYGKSAQVKGPTFLEYPKVSDYFEHLKVFSDGKFYEGPAVTAVHYGPTTYNIKIGKNIKMEGFPHMNDKPIVTRADKRKESWGAEKKFWKKAHPGDEFVLDKGVVVKDYAVKAYF